MVASSCGRNVDLQAIRLLSDEAVKAADLFNEDIAGDIYDSCVRAAEYQPVILTASPGRDPFQLRTDRLSACNEEPRQLETELRATHQILTTYLVALGKLASDEAVNLDGIDTIQKSFQDLPASTLTAEQKSAGVSILNILGIVIRSIVDQSRLETLQRVIVATDSDVQTFGQGFHQIAERSYIKQLEAENQAIDNYYQIYIQGVLAELQQGNTRDMTNYVMGLQEEWRGKRDSVDEKIKLAERYIRVIEGIAGTHSDLKNKFAKGEMPDAQQVNRIVNSYAAELKTLTQQIEATYK